MRRAAFFGKILVKHAPWRSNMTMATVMTEEPQAAPRSPQFAYKSEWKRTTAVPLTRENFLDLLHGKSPLIREPGFLSPKLA